MAFPKTEQELADQGYVFEERGKCRSEACGRDVLWYRTPKGKRMPLDPGTLVPHFATCPEIQKFRNRTN